MSWTQSWIFLTNTDAKYCPEYRSVNMSSMIAEAAIQKGFFSTPRLCLYIFILVGGSLQGTYVSYIQLIMQMVGGVYSFVIGAVPWKAL